MNILITGAGGFVGKNLVENLKNIKEGKNPTRPNLFIGEIYEYNRDTDKGGDRSILEEYCRKVDFIFHLAGVNRPKKDGDFQKGNVDFLELMLETLKRLGSRAPVMLASSVQASLAGRYGQSLYGKSKLAGEELLIRHSLETGGKVFIYRFPNLFGKWCRPNYNSVVATFCNAVARDLEYTVNDRDARLELVYIDDVVEEMLDALEGKEHRCEYAGTVPVEKSGGPYCYVPISYHVTLGEIVDLLKLYKRVPKTLTIPRMPEGSFEKKLYSTYLSYMPKEAVCYPLSMNEDGRGVFTELLKMENCGQVSVNVARPGSVRGQHWHNSKWELFIVVSGHGLIQERKIGKDENGKPYPVMEFEVHGEKMEAVCMLPGYAHNIINLSETENLVTVMWANEWFDRNRPDTFFEKVDREKNF